ncbi:hypothetical protein FOA52_015764 [Chlamydomonas sp. UWO 241]|nr:hypothetical protein FOA52_015764 [Chlamydomonas sp. UWO 241]
MSSAMQQYATRECSNPSCAKSEHDVGVALKKCQKCKKYNNPEPAIYCSTACQTAHWPAHKGQCNVAAAPELADGDWSAPWRKCQDGSYHHGTLELITWDCDEPQSDGSIVKMGWGGTDIDESEELKAQFEGELDGSKKKLLKHFDSAFRWTCCGLNAGSIWGCDHHGDPNARQACKCDYCKVGRPLPDDVWERKLKSQAAQGLPNLRRGPDQRTGLNPGMRMAGELTMLMRDLFGMDTV